MNKFPKLPSSFIEDFECIKDDLYFNTRTKTYVWRGSWSARIQLDEGGDETFSTTMPYTSSYYNECIKVEFEQIMDQF